MSDNGKSISLRGLTDSLDLNGPWYITSSEEFKAVRTSFERYKKMLAEGNFSEQLRKKMLEGMSKLASLYLNKKSKQFHLCKHMKPLILWSALL